MGSSPRLGLGVGVSLRRQMYGLGGCVSRCVYLCVWSRLWCEGGMG